MGDQQRPDQPKSLPAGEAGPATEETTFVRLLEGIRDCAIYMIDRNGRVTSWNAGAERIKGYSAEEIIGQHFSEFYTPEDRAAGLPSLR